MSRKARKEALLPSLQPQGPADCRTPGQGAHPGVQGQVPVALRDRIDFFGDGQNDRCQATQGSRLVCGGLLRPVKGDRGEHLQGCQGEKGTGCPQRATLGAALSGLGFVILVVKECVS